MWKERIQQKKLNESRVGQPSDNGPKEAKRESEKEFVIERLKKNPMHRGFLFMMSIQCATSFFLSLTSCKTDK